MDHHCHLYRIAYLIMFVSPAISYANKESFTRAIQDFEDALAANPAHVNAKNYLIETLLTCGKG